MMFWAAVKGIVMVKAFGLVLYVLGVAVAICIVLWLRLRR